MRAIYSVRVLVCRGYLKADKPCFSMLTWLDHPNLLPNPTPTLDLKQTKVKEQEYVIIKWVL